MPLHEREDLFVGRRKQILTYGVRKEIRMLLDWYIGDPGSDLIEKQENHTYAIHCLVAIRCLVACLLPPTFCWWLKLIQFANIRFDLMMS